MQTSRESLQSGLIRRWAEVLAFVGVWIVAGLLLDMSPYTYLLFGIPLTAGFQLFVRKRPIKDLWVRGGPSLSLRSVSLKLADIEQRIKVKEREAEARAKALERRIRVRERAADTRRKAYEEEMREVEGEEGGGGLIQQSSH